MAYHNTILSQLLKLIPRLEFERLGNQHDGRRRSDACVGALCRGRTYTND